MKQTNKSMYFNYTVEYGFLRIERSTDQMLKGMRANYIVLVDFHGIMNKAKRKLSFRVKDHKSVSNNIVPFFDAFTTSVYYKFLRTSIKNQSYSSADAYV